jgi:DNA-binding NarL/FixJ family response regulator
VNPAVPRTPPEANRIDISNDRPEHRIRLVVLDELVLFRSSLSRFLSDSGFEVVGECGTAAEALEISRRTSVDIILLDAETRPEQGEDFISVARQNGYEGQFLILTCTLEGRKSAIALKRGATGIFLKSEPPERLIQAIRAIANGEMWVDQKIIQLLADQSIDRSLRIENRRAPSLGDRERIVLQGVVDGLSNRKIADNLGLSESSVKNVLQKLFAMTSVRTRSQLVRLALEGSLGSVINRQPDEVEGTPKIAPCP